MWREWEHSFVTAGQKIENAETYDEVVSRAVSALDYLKQRDESSLLVVSHGYFIRTLLGRILLGSDLTPPLLRRFYELIAIENTGLTVIVYKAAFEEPPRWRLTTLNDRAHFAE